MKTSINYAIAFLILLSPPAFANDYDDGPRPRPRQAKKYVKKQKKKVRKALTARQRRVRRARIAAAQRARVAAAQRSRIARAPRSAPPRRTAPKPKPPVAATNPPAATAPKSAPKSTSSSTPARKSTTASRIDPRVAGVWRGGAKITVARTPDGREAPVEVFGSLASMMETLPSDAEYGARNGIFAGSKAYDPNTRFRGERRNVRVPCWIHGVRYDSTSGMTGRDIQIIIGTSSDITRSQIMIIEIPRARGDGGPDDPRFELARREAIRLVPAPSAFSGYHRTGPRPALVEGSLFFDGIHTAGTAGAPGPDWAKPTTVWEIHPVTSLLIEERRLGEAGR